MDPRTHLQHVVQSAPLILYAIDRDGIFTLSEGRGLAAMGLAPGQVVGQSALALYGQIPWVVENLRRALAGEEVTAEGEVGGRWYQVRYKPLFDAAGRPDGALGLAVDVTTERALQARAQAVDRLTAAGQLAAGVAHELQNPLTMVAANLGGLRERLRNLGGGTGAPTGAELRALEEMIAEAEDGAARARSLLKDLAVFSRPETGDEPATTDLGRCLEACARLAKGQLAGRGGVLVEIGEAHRVRISESRLGQILVALLLAFPGDPVRRGGAGKIVVASRLDRGDVVVAVEHAGAGGVDLGGLFEAGSGAGGSGGLMLARRMAREVGGEVFAEPLTGGVVRLSLRLPVAREELASPEAAGGRAGRETRPLGGRILVVDDEAVIGRIIQRILAPPHEVTVETQAKVALERLVRGERFDLVLCDLMMPGMSGMQLHAEVTRLASDQLPGLVFLSGGAFESRIEAFLAACGSPCIEKPFDSEGLKRRVAELLPRRLRLLPRTG